MLAWTWGVTQSGGGYSGGGGGSGKASFQEFDFVTRISIASPLLVIASASGTHHPWAELTGVRTGNKSVAFLKYRLSDVLVDAVRHADDEDGAPIEEFSLRYRTFEITYTPQKASGKLGTPVHAGWDSAQNKKL